MQDLEPDLRVLLLVVRRLEEEVPDLLETVLLRLRPEKGVFVARLAFAREGRQQVCLGFGTL